MMDFVLPLLIYPLFFLILFVVAEWLYHRANVHAEYTRKIVHAGTGLLTMGFPVYFDSFWQVIIICTLFLVILVASRKLNMLHSINNVSRRTEGSVLYPVIVIIAFLFYQYMNEVDSRNPVHFYLPILIMAISDPVAALAGTRFKKDHTGMKGKTTAGTLAFAASAFIIAMILLAVFMRLSFVPLIGWSFVISIATALAERASNGGWDNFTIPLTAMSVLYLINHLQ